MDSILEIAGIGVLTLLNAFFALAEIAVVSSRKPRLEQLARDGHRGAATALALAENPDRFLSTIQLGITCVGIFAGAVGGATLGERFGEFLFPYLGASATPVAFIVVVGGITSVSVIFGELIPKRVALSNPEPWACLLAQPISGFSKILGIFVTALTKVTEKLVAALPLKEVDNPSVSEEEIAIMAERGTEEGVLHEVEEEMLKKVLRLDRWHVSAIMTPRRDVVVIDINDSSRESWARMVSSKRSHFPVVDGSAESIIGTISLKELLQSVLNGEEVNFREFLEKPLVVPESASILKLIESLKEAGTHIAVVVDEHGSFSGLATLHDILQALVGVVEDDDEGHRPEIVEREDGSFLIDASVHVEQLMDLLELDDVPLAELKNYQTLGGFILARLGEIPSEGQRFNYQGVIFEVIDMDGNRIDKVLVIPPIRDKELEQSAAGEE